MNLKKLVQIALFLPIAILSGCEEWKPDEVLLQNIWKEVVKITEIDPKTPMPKVVFLEITAPGVRGKFSSDNNNDLVEVYLGSASRLAWQAREAYKQSGGAIGYDIGYKDSQAMLYDTAAHEMLHSALYRKGVPGEFHHRQMKEKGYFLPVLSYINDYFKINAGFKSNRNGCHVDLAMISLEKGIEWDKKETAK